MTPQRTAKLDRRLVADTALRLLGELGLEGVTLRAIAAELNVKAPALYWHFKDKQALLDEMATEIMRRMTADLSHLIEPSAPAQAQANATAQGVPAEAGEWAGEQDWRPTYLGTMRTLRAHLLRYRDGARVYSGARFTDRSYAPNLDASLRLLVRAGFSVAAASRAWYTGYTYTIGYVVEEQAMGPNPFDGTDGYDLDARAERLADYPLAAAAGSEMFRDYEQGFEQGLALVLAGVEATLSPH
ncbi:TetR/AcrR family transcriptional regulator C-terminal domain-containing protein [Streptacidiphilus anmyonensis]|uniref:TetR/AcrR family transcriptional regulator C-terminal domain-containing protein n=1 Tax=Streptacidiphilus anmyonensis TaxID=405782 RepID=UPI0005A96709|nr:TetR/AcrR family transcriptional regulator C-terminal domain-containing protein [Streptacidiphilus anmyonensis]